MTLVHLGLLDPSDIIDDSQPPTIPPLPGLGKVHVCMYVCMYVRMCVCMCVCVCKYVCMYVCT